VYIIVQNTITVVLRPFLRRASVTVAPFDFLLGRLLRIDLIQSV